MWPKYWRISLSPSSAYSRLISFHCSSVAKLWATLCNPMDGSTPGFLVHYQLPEFAQTDVHPVSYVIQLPHLLSSPSPVFNLSQHWVFIFFLRSQFWTSAGQSIGVSASAKVLPMNIQDWFPLGLTGLISLQSKGLSRVFSSTTVQNYEFLSTEPSLWPKPHISTWVLEKFKKGNKTTIALTVWTFVGKVLSLLFNTLPWFVIAFLLQSKHLNFMAALTIHSDFGAEENKLCHCFHSFSFYLPWSVWTGCYDLSFLNVEF